MACVHTVQPRSPLSPLRKPSLRALRPPRLRGSGLSRGEVAREFLRGTIERALQLIVELFPFGDAAEELRIAAFDVFVELGLERADVRHRDVVEVAIRAGIDDRDLSLDRQRLVLR